MEVRLSALEEALARGHDSPDCLSEETGAGSACGSCFGELIELAGNASWDAMELVAIDELATGLLRLELAPRPGQALEPALAGQHVLLQALIDGAWVQRPYTLISPAGETRGDAAHRLLLFRVAAELRGTEDSLPAGSAQSIVRGSRQRAATQE